MSTSSLPWPARASVMLYRSLLFVYPRRFRERFGQEVVEAFSDSVLATWQAHGIIGLARLWVRTLADLAAHGVRERLPAKRLRDSDSPAAARPARTGGDSCALSPELALAITRLSQRPSTGKASITDSLAQDVRFALRTLRSAPGFTVAIIATIALGIGANIAIFTVVDGIVLRPLPFADSDRVVSLCETHERLGDYCVASPPNVRDWVEMSASLATAGVARTWIYAMQDEEGTTNVRAGIATPGYLEVHRFAPLAGRLLEEADLVDGNNHVVVLTHAFWQSRFGGDADAVGRQIVLDDNPFTIVGVLPPDAWFHTFASAEIWTPLTASPENTDNRDWRGFVALGRLSDGPSLAAARDELESVRAALEEQYPEVNRGWGVEMDWLRDRVAGRVRSILLLFLGAVGFVLLIGCANVANLMLVRATERTQEFAVRASLGAGRRRIVRQLLTESLLLAFAGGLTGFAMAIGATRTFLALAPDSIPRLEEVGVDLRALGFALALSAGTAIVFGLAPAWRAAKTDLNATLKAARHGDARSGGLRGALVVAEIALALMLLVGAGLLTRSFATLLDWDPGFDREDLVTTWGLANFTQVETTAELNDMFDQVAREIEAIPGVTAVGQTSAGPLFGGIETDLFVIEGRTDVPPEERPSVRWYNIDPRYFDTMGIPLVRGRDLTDADHDGSVPVAIINETMARRHWAGTNPLGQRVTVSERTAVEIVGIVRDVRPFEPDAATAAEIYFPKRQFSRGATYYVIRSDVELASLEMQVRERLTPLEPYIELSSFVPFQRRADDRLISPRFNMILVAIFAAVAIILAAIGTYGVIAYTVASRTHEIGIRIAVGAQPRNIVLTVVRSGITLTLTGMAVGVAGALLLSRFLGHLLHGLPPNDIVTYVGVSAVFLLVALAACGLPALRASRLDPVTALRTE